MANPQTIPLHEIRMFVTINQVALIDTLLYHGLPDDKGIVKAEFKFPPELRCVKITLDMSKPWSDVIGKIVNRMAKFYIKQDTEKK